MNTAVPILMYHQVSLSSAPGYTKYIVAEKTFAAQMSWLARTGYRAINLDTLMEYRLGRVSLQGQPVVITFDDGYRDLAEYAVPILESHGFTAIFYLVAGLMGQTTRWLASERGIALPLMDWATARRLASTGFQCGSHTMSHPRLPDLPEAACRAELAQSRQKIQEQLGSEVRHLSYPYGRYNENIRAIAVESGYRTACSVEIGFSTVRDDLLGLHRVPITGNDSLIDFIWRLQTAYPFGEWLRRKKDGALRRLRLQHTGAAR